MSKIRVYQLANELNRENSQIIRELQTLGAPVTSHSNTVEDEIADELLKKLGVRDDRIRVYRLARGLNCDNDRILRELKSPGVPSPTPVELVEERLADEVRRRFRRHRTDVAEAKAPVERTRTDGHSEQRTAARKLGGIRLHDLAQYLHRDSSEVIEELQRLGVSVAGASSVVEVGLAEAVCQSLGPVRPAPRPRPAAVAPEPPPKPSPQPMKVKGVPTYLFNLMQLANESNRTESRRGSTKGREGSLPRKTKASSRRATRGWRVKQSSVLDQIVTHYRSGKDQRLSSAVLYTHSVLETSFKHCLKEQGVDVFWKEGLTGLIQNYAQELRLDTEDLNQLSYIFIPFRNGVVHGQMRPPKTYVRDFIILAARCLSRLNIECPAAMALKDDS